MSKQVVPTELEHHIAGGGAYDSSAEPYDISRWEWNNGDQQIESFREAYHAAGYDESEGDDTDTGSQRFVTPLPSHHSLRFVSQQHKEAASGAGVHDYIGRAYHGENGTGQYELEHQHSTTVQGEDDLFDDTDRSEDHVATEAVTEHVGTGSQGTPVMRPNPGKVEQSVDYDISDEGNEERRAHESYPSAGGNWLSSHHRVSSPTRRRFSPLSSPTGSTISRHRGSDSGAGGQLSPQQQH
ncbi:hypothetical protein C7999DRAFT_15960 [Corynascus novoguineensis]|uniref:Uncharacterized protein n=1 Tax=Corynascus novoguineensis TaxID=1126955 RepID=A0AAN7CR38_9PEZI|nr:hypothetical protein C7999DRAFT_15960 [Corynascus novoguineensis]